MIKKSLGQNFFVNENLGKQIIRYVDLSNSDLVVEIGPGRGFFTKKIHESKKKLLLVEKDDELALTLKQDFPDAKVINKDFLEWDMKELKAYQNKKIIFFGSLPYNVSKPIIQKIISSKYFNNNCYFIIQKEVAEKYIAKAPNNNILSIRTQLFADVKKILDINPGAFLPRPKVNSSFVLFSPNNKTTTDIDLDKFISFIERAFKSPRKTLNNNLKGLNINIDSKELLTKRPADITLAQYLEIFTNLS